MNSPLGKFAGFVSLIAAVLAVLVFITGLANLDDLLLGRSESPEARLVSESL